jgi:large subunit ribosomal protein L4
MEAKVYNQKGKEVESIVLPEAVFGLPWNGDLVHQVVTGMQSNKRAGTADTKDRSEVSGGGRKPYQQKGTGRARHGSTRSPIWKGGGVAHGPITDKSYKKKINSKMRAKALLTLLSAKYKDGKILFVDSINLENTKTKDAFEVVKSLSTVPTFGHLSYKKKNNVSLVTPVKDDTIRLSFRNLENISLEMMSQINPLDVANARYIIITSPKESIEVLSKKLG